MRNEKSEQLVVSEHGGPLAPRCARRRRRVDDIWVVVQCRVGDASPELVAGRTFCYLHVNLDVDLYEPTRDCLRHVHPQPCDSAVVLFDELYHPSPEEGRAVCEHLQQTGEVLHPGPICQAALDMGVTSAPEQLRGGTRWSLPADVLLADLSARAISFVVHHLQAVRHVLHEELLDDVPLCAVLARPDGDSDLELHPST